MSYYYKVRQGKPQITLTLSCDAQQPLLTVIAAFFYHHKKKAVLEAPIVLQDNAQVLEEQVEAEFEKLKLFMKEKEIVR